MKTVADKKLRTLKLQINEHGAWRTVAAFAPDELAEFKKDAIRYARRKGACATWRISKDSRTAIAYLEAPSFKWRNA